LRCYWVPASILALSPLLGWAQGAMIEPLPYPFAALDWSAESGREEAEMWLRVSGLPPIDVRCTPLSFEWTFQGCGAHLADPEHHPPGAELYLRFTSPGVCHVSVDVSENGSEGCTRTWHAEADVYVLGGPISVQIRDHPQHYDIHQDSTTCWYLSYYGYNVGYLVPRKRSEQATSEAWISADRAAQQPPGTRFRWTVTHPGVFTSNPALNGTTQATSITIKANGPSNPGQIQVRLEYELDIPGWGTAVVPDDTDNVPRPPHNVPSSNYRRFTGHKPIRVELAEMVVNPINTISVIGPPEWVYQDDYYYTLFDQLSAAMRGVWVQERFPDGVPTHYNDGRLLPQPFLWNGATGSYWITLINNAQNPTRPFGTFGPDHIILADTREWPSDGPPGLGPLRHEYWAGTKGAFANDGGCKVGEFQMSMWTDATAHW